MAALEPHYLAMLEQVLRDEYVPFLPPLLDGSEPAEQNKRKNLSRAFSAFSLKQICSISVADAAKAVIDDFDDCGVDAVYYHPQTDALYLVQAKLKASEQFGQDEALAFCQGVRKLIKQDLSEFNSNVLNRSIEIESAMDNCACIRLVVAHTGNGISSHAKKAVEDLLLDEDHGEERFDKTVVVYDAKRVVQDLQGAKAYERVDANICLQKCESIKEPRATYFGLMQLSDLVNLHQLHGKALYERNIRTFLGHKTDVNTSIRQTLAENPEEFLYFPSLG